MPSHPQKRQRTEEANNEERRAANEIACDQNEEDLFVFARLPNELKGRALDYLVPSNPINQWQWFYTMRSIIKNLDEELVPTEFNLFKAARDWVPKQHDVVKWLVSTPWVATKIKKIKATSPGLGFGSVGMFVSDKANDMWLLLFDSVHVFENVEEVYVSYHTIWGDSFLSGLAKKLKNLTRLEINGLWNESLLRKELSSFAESAQQPMHTLALDNCETLSAKTMESFLRLHGRMLKVLNFKTLSGCTNAALQVVGRYCRSLKQFSATYSIIDETVLSTILKANPDIIYLDLSDCSLLRPHNLIRALVEDSPNLQVFRGNSCYEVDDDFLMQLVTCFMDKSTKEQQPMSLHTIGIKRTLVTVNGLRQVLSQAPSLGRGKGVIEVSLLRDNTDEEVSSYRYADRRDEQLRLEADFDDVNFACPYIAR